MFVGAGNNAINHIYTCYLWIVLLIDNGHSHDTVRVEVYFSSTSFWIQTRIYHMRRNNNNDDDDDNNDFFHFEGVTLAKTENFKNNVIVG